MAKIFIIAGPSGVGKDTIIDGVKSQIPDLEEAISYTDREKRMDDKPDSYFFVPKDKFDSLIKEGKIIEWEYARDERRYGSSKKEIGRLLNSGKNLIKVVGPKSLVNFKKLFPGQLVGIFLKYENLDILKDRIRKNRPDITEEDLETRYNQAFEDMKCEKDYDYSVENPEGHPEIAIKKVTEIIEKEL